MKNSIAKYR